MPTTTSVPFIEGNNKILNAQKMTPERLQTFPGFEKINEEQAKQIIETLECFCGTIVKHVSKKENDEKS
jgi:hypothetical protein